MLWCFLSRGLWPEAHPFSLSQVPTDSSLRITVKDLGDFTRRLAQVRPGTRVIAEGPFGIFTAARKQARNSVLIAGGIGITPIRAMLEDLPEDTIVLYRTVREDEQLFASEMKDLSNRSGARVAYLIGDHRTDEGSRLLTAEHIRELVPDISHRDVFVCGPPAMADAIARNARAAGALQKHIHVERFAL